MRKFPRKKISLGDLMVMVATIAFSWFCYNSMYRMNLEKFNLRGSLFKDFIIYFSPSYPVVVVASLATLILRLMKPRPHGLRLRRQPGFIASLAVIFMVFQRTVFFFSVNWPIPDRDRWFGEYLLEISGPYNVAQGVVLAWIAQKVCGAWRPEKTWIDRLGRAVGLTWIVYYLILLAWNWFRIGM